MKDCLEWSRQQRAERGFNDSVSHVDFMFGTEDLLVVGQRDDGSGEPSLKRAYGSFEETGPKQGKNINRLFTIMAEACHEKGIKSE